MNNLKEFFKKFRIVDFIILACVVIALGVGFITEMFLIQIWTLLMLKQTEEKLFYLL